MKLKFKSILNQIESNSTMTHTAFFLNQKKNKTKYPYGPELP